MSSTQDLALRRTAFNSSLAILRTKHREPTVRKALGWPDAWLCQKCRHPFILHEPWYSHQIADEMNAQRHDPPTCTEGCDNCWSDLVTP